MWGLADLLDKILQVLDAMVTRDLARMKKLPAQIQIFGLHPRGAASIEGVSARTQMQAQGLLLHKMIFGLGFFC